MVHDVDSGPLFHVPCPQLGVVLIAILRHDHARLRRRSWITTSKLPLKTLGTRAPPLPAAPPAAPASVLVSPVVAMVSAIETALAIVVGLHGKRSNRQTQADVLQSISWANGNRYEFLHQTLDWVVFPSPIATQTSSFWGE